MGSSIEACPAEIVEGVVQYLAFSDICELRLSYRLLAEKASQDTFKSFFSTKHVAITKDRLEAFVDMTRRGRIGCQIENLVLVGMAIDTQLLEKILQGKARWVTETNGPMFCSSQHKCTPEELSQVRADLNILQRRQREKRQLNCY